MAPDVQNLRHCRQEVPVCQQKLLLITANCCIEMQAIKTSANKIKVIIIAILN